MRILLITHHYPPEVGAAPYRWEALIKGFVAGGHHVAVLAPSPHFPRRGVHHVPPELRPGARHLGRHGEWVIRLSYVEHSHGLRLRVLDQVVTALDTIRRGLCAFGVLSSRPDVIVATAPGLPSIPAGLVLRFMLRRPLVVEMRDAWPDLVDNHHEWGSDSTSRTTSSRKTSLLANIGRRALVRGVTFLQRHADAIVTTTESFADELRARCMASVSTVRNSAMAHQWVKPPPAPPLDRKTLRVLYLGTVGRSQGLSSAIYAVMRLSERGVPIRLRIVGDGASRPGLMQLAERLGAPVEFLTPVPRVNVAQYYRWTDTVLVSLRGWEPFRWTVPSKLYEALASGRHLTAALSGEAAEIVDEASAGNIVAPGDVDGLVECWKKLAADRTRLDVGHEGIRWVEAHASADALAEQYLTTLERVRAASRRPPSRPRQVAKNSALLITAAIAHAAEDPLLLMLQVSRRLPVRLREPLSRALTAFSNGNPRLLAAYGQWLADRPSEAVRTLGRLRATGSRARRRLIAELGVQLGSGDSAMMNRPATRARAAWAHGDVSAAVVALSGSPGISRDRMTGERRLLQPGFRLQVPRHPSVSAQTMTVLHLLTNSLPTTHSGYAIRSHEVLKAQRSSGIEASAVTRIGYPVTVGLACAKHQDVVDGITYRRLLPARLQRTPVQRLQQMATEVLRVADEVRPSVLHTTTNYTNALVIAAIAAASGLPWIYEVRGLLEDSWVASLPAAVRAEAAKSERYRLLKARETEMAAAADAVVTLSDTLRDDLVSRGVPAGRITVVPNGVDAALLERSVAPDTARTWLGMPRDGFWVGTVSSLVDYEGLDTLIFAVAELRRRGVDARCCIVGDGISRPALAAQAYRLGIGGHVRLPGRVPRETAAVYHQALDVFVIPRKDRQVCRTVTPLKPVEAMALGRPIVASDLPALREIVASPESGLMVRPEDAHTLADTLQRLAEEPLLRASFGKAGRDFAAHRTWPSMCQRYRDLYARLTPRERQNSTLHPLG
jgi:glycosyltransferase involved in cell wall biosynthesis